MEDPGETEAHPLGATSLNFVPGYQQEEKPSPDPLYDTPDARGVQAGGSQQPARTVSLRERLLITRPVWLQLRANAAAALHVLRTEPPGTFLVRKSNTRQCQTLCVRLPEASGPSFVSSHYLQESPGGEEGGLEGRGWKTGRGGRFPENGLTPNVSQASLWRAQSSHSRTWSSSSVHTVIPGTFFSSLSDSPEPFIRQPPTKSWRPSPIWAWSSGVPLSTPRTNRDLQKLRRYPG